MLSQRRRQKPYVIFMKALILTIGGGGVFWITTIATSVLPIAAEYRAAYSNWSIQTVWIDSLPAGMIIGCCVSYSLLRLFEKIPTGDPILKSMLLSFVVLTIATILIDVPRSILLPGPSDALYYFLIGVMFNAARFLFLGLAIGYLYKRLYGATRSQIVGNDLSGYSLFKGEKKMNTTKESLHGTDRKAAAVVGVLFILGTVPALLVLPLYGNTVNAPDHLTAIATNEGQMIILTAMKFLMGVACAGIGLALYPILRRYNEGLAFGAAGFRVIEGVVDVVGALLLVILLALSQEFVKAGALESSYFQAADVLINAGIAWLRDVAMLLTFSIGALMYYMIFYQFRLVPRWLTVWGLVGITLTIISALLVMFHLIPPFGTIQVILNLPILPQEMVLAVWLIIKGINPSAVAFLPAKTTTNELLGAA